MTDWLARRVGSVIDFRLPGDPNDIPSHVFRARTLEYLAQLRDQSPTRNNEVPPVNQPDSRGLKPHTGDLFAEYESVTHG